MHGLETHTRLSVIIPAWHAEATLAATLGCLDGADDILVVDGGSTDRTAEIAQAWGARVIAAPKGRGRQLNAGAVAAHHDWMLFVHADTRLQTGWRTQAVAWCNQVEMQQKAAVFRFALDDDAWQARVIEKAVAMRVSIFGLPYGDQGLLIHRSLFQSLGLFRPIALMEDVDAALRIGRKRMHLLPAAASTSAQRWRKEGWFRRSGRNLLCLTLFRLGYPLEKIQAIYEA